MNDETARKLREPFRPEDIGKLPRVTCGQCRNAQSKACPSHPKAKCGECGNWMTPRHMHLDYVGHAELTDRLLQVDPEWNWEPVAFDGHGAPLLDANGGMWIRLTIAGVTRLGYGHPDGKRGGDAIKETIGDALRNAAMRFGVALDLWRREPAHVDDDGGDPAPPAESAGTAPSEADRARDEIRAWCQQNDVSLAWVATDFGKRTDKDIRTADGRTLRDYLTLLTSGLATPAAEAGAP